MNSLCIFCGSSFGDFPEYRKEAARFGTALARRGIDLVYGGSDAGLMGITARAVLEQHGRVTGIITRELYERTRDLEVTELIIVDSMHERKAAMYSRSDAFAALPGGIGTLEELLESFTWNQLGIHRKPVGLFNIQGFFTPLLSLLDHLTEHQFLPAVQREQLLCSDDPNALLDMLVSRKES